jgi:hypothetical protein
VFTGLARSVTDLAVGLVAARFGTHASTTRRDGPQQETGEEGDASNDVATLVTQRAYSDAADEGLSEEGDLNEDGGDEDGGNRHGGLRRTVTSGI